MLHEEELEHKSAQRKHPVNPETKRPYPERRENNENEGK
jgi:hypothetical protein